jgi:hypothetical protein
VVTHEPAEEPGIDCFGGWGLHVMDANIAMGDIEALVAGQAGAYLG